MIEAVDSQVAVFIHESRVPSSLETVWRFHNRVEGLVQVTPPFLQAKVEGVVRPSPRITTDELVPGTRIQLSVKPIGVGPRQRLTTEVVATEHEADRAAFQDVMIEGPFQRWGHTHEFVADGDYTIVRDVVVYELPGGKLGSIFSPLAWPGFELVFRYRHRKTRALLSEEGKTC